MLTIAQEHPGKSTQAVYAQITKENLFLTHILRLTPLFTIYWKTVTFWGFKNNLIVHLELRNSKCRIWGLSAELNPFQNSYLKASVITLSLWREDKQFIKWLHVSESPLFIQKQRLIQTKFHISPAKAKHGIRSLKEDRTALAEHGQLQTWFIKFH